MEPIAENTTTVTQPLFFEAMAAADNYRETALKGMGVMAAAWVVLAGITVFRGMSLGLALMELAVLAAVGLWLIVLYPRSRYKRGFKAMQDRYDGDLTRQIHFYRDRLVIDTCLNSAEFTYHEIIRIRKTRNLLLLVCADKTGLFFALDGFSKGDADTVVQAVEKVILYYETIASGSSKRNKPPLIQSARIFRQIQVLAWFEIPMPSVS